MKRQNLKKWLLVAAALPVLSACDMMKEDLDDCPTGLYVTFVYDYNLLDAKAFNGADVFKDQVGSVMLYVYDESDQLVATKTMGDGYFASYGKYMHFSEQELAPGHRYRLVALAMQKDYNDALSQPGQKYRISGNTIGSPRSALTVALDHESIAASRTVGAALSPQLPATRATLSGAPLDTLWHTLITIDSPAASHPLQSQPIMLYPEKTDYHLNADGTVRSNGVETISLVEGEPSYATMSLIRDTKHLNISLRELDTPENVDADDYDVFIIDDNTLLDYQNNVVHNGDSVIYRPYASWTSTFDGEGQVANERSAHYDLMFNRLMYNQKTDDNAVLCIRKKTTGEEVAVINLPYILSQGRTAYEIRGYQPQEYLDRENDYRLQFFIKNGRWTEIYIHIDVLSWAKRIQYVDL